MSLRCALLISTVCAAFVADPASAQYGTRESRLPPTARPAESTPPGGEITRLSANDQIRLQLTKTGIALGLTAEQKPLWEGYRREALALLEQRPSEASTEEVTVLTPFSERSNILRARLVAFDRLGEAAKKLYSALSEEQRKTADRMLSATIPPPYPTASDRPPER